MTKPYVNQRTRHISRETTPAAALLAAYLDPLGHRWGNSGDDGPATDAELDHPYSVTETADGVPDRRQH